MREEASGMSEVRVSQAEGTASAKALGQVGGTVRAGMAGKQLGKVGVKRNREVMGQPGAPGRPPRDSDFSLRGIGSPGRTVRRGGHVMA